MMPVLKSIAKTFIPVAIVAFCINATGCVYRFTNTYVALPAGVKSIAVEAIYNTSREVLPHEILWNSIQAGFAKEGHLRLSSTEDADVLLRTQIVKAAITPYGLLKPSGPANDPERNTETPHPDPNRMQVLTQAGSFTQQERINCELLVDVIDLRSKNVLFKRSYVAEQVFTSARGDNIAKRNTHYLLHEEAVNASFKKISESLSTSIVNDVLKQLSRK